MEATETKSVYCMPKIGQGWSGFSFNDYCFDNLAKYNISAFLEHYELVHFFDDLRNKGSSYDV